MLHSTRTSSRVFALAIAAFLTLVVTDEGASHAQAAANLRILLSFPGIDGESLAKGFERHIDVDSFSVGVASSPTSGSARASGKATGADVAITKHADATSPLFFERITSGKVAPEVSITVLRGSQVALTYKLTNVSVVSFQEHATSSGDAVDQLSLHYEALAIEATKTGKSAGVAKHAFDFARNRAL